MRKWGETLLRYSCLSLRRLIDANSVSLSVLGTVISQLAHRLPDGNSILLSICKTITFKHIESDSKSIPLELGKAIIFRLIILGFLSIFFIHLFYFPSVISQGKKNILANIFVITVILGRLIITVKEPFAAAPICISHYLPVISSSCV